jgi:hypothetical protein
MRLAVQASAQLNQPQGVAQQSNGHSRRRTKMPNTLSITGCAVDNDSITISFSAPVDQSATDTGVGNPENFSVYDPAVGAYSAPVSLDTTWSVSFPDDQSVTWTLSAGAPNFNPGDYVLVTVSNIALAASPGTSALIDDPVSIARQVPGTSATGTITQNVQDAVSYPILTEEIGYRPSPVGMPSGGGGGYGSGGGGGSSIGQMAMKAVSDVLGWKANNTDPKGFIGALTQSFTLTDVEGHVESSWSPRTYAVQTDLGGGISGAQASLYLRAKDALDQSLSLLNGLYPLDPEADPEYVKALREMARSQMTEIVKEFGVVGLPSILRIDTYFGILLGQNPAQLISSGTQVRFDPDSIAGTLGILRDTYGIFFEGNTFNNSVEDEQDITNFRVISDYMTSLMQSWIANRQFFILSPDNLAFFGTQLVLISRQFNVIAETVNEVRFALDSVFIGPSERQTLLLEFSDPTLSPMFVEDVLEEVENFVTDEGPRLLRDGGKISVTNNILPVVESLQNMVEQAHNPSNILELPDGFRTARVRNSLDDLDDQLDALINLVEQVEQQVPEGEDVINISGITVPQQPAGSADWVFSIFGNAFDPFTSVIINSPTAVVAKHVEFFSPQRIDATVAAADWSTLSSSSASHDVTVTNSDGESTVLSNAFTITNGGPVLGMKRAGLAGKALAGKVAPGKAVRPAASAKSAQRPGAGASPAGKASGKFIAAPPTPPPAAPAPAAVSALQNQLQQLQKSHDELTKGHADIKQKLDDMWEKMMGYFEGKNKDKKDKGD